MNQSFGRGQHMLEHNKDCLFLSMTPNTSEFPNMFLILLAVTSVGKYRLEFSFVIWSLVSNWALMYQGKAFVCQDGSSGCQQIAPSVPRTWAPLWGPVPGPGFVEKALLVSGKLFQAALMMFTWKEKEGRGRKHLNPCRVWSLLWSHPVWSPLWVSEVSVVGVCFLELCVQFCAVHGYKRLLTMGVCDLEKTGNDIWAVLQKMGFHWPLCYWTEVICSVF